MAAVTFDIDYTEQRSRVTTLFRGLLAIPHLIVVSFLASIAQFVAFVQWFIILFTGKRNEGIWNLTSGILNWQARAITYAGLMYDTYPAFAFEPAGEPVRFGATYEADANRLSNAFRLIWAIPAMIISAVLGIVGNVVTVICWFAILITGSQPQGMFDLLLKVHRYNVQANAYLLMLTDTYPSFG